MANPKEKWWSSLTDECPITLEPLSALPYPPFILTDRNQDTGGNVKKSLAGVTGVTATNGCGHHFDGLALATYIVSQGAFANPLTREPLQYQDCARLDEYLAEHIYHEHSNHSQQAKFSSVLGSRSQRICVKEAWLLRDSIKVKVGGGSLQTESQRRRAEALRNEAAAALRGLFVFGHRSENRSGHGNGWESSVQTTNNSQSLPRAPGGFNLYHNPNATSNSYQEGLRIIDDDEAKFEAADMTAWRDIQEAFPTLNHLNGDVTPKHHLNSSDDNSAPSEMLETMRQTASLTVKEENEKAERQRITLERYFLQALERKRERINARRRDKEEAATALLLEKEAGDVLESAKNEIDQWRAQQWEEWERIASMHQSNTKTTPERAATTKAPPEPSESSHNKQAQSTTQNQELTAEEKAAKAAAKKKAKRQKAKERAKEKKRLEQLELEKKERALARAREKEASAKKCGCCGQGILGHGFEKFGANFCSTKCARNGPSLKC